MIMMSKHKLEGFTDNLLQETYSLRPLIYEMSNDIVSPANSRYMNVLLQRSPH